MTTGGGSIGIYRAEYVNVRAFAAHVSRCFSVYGASGALVMGDPDRRVARVAIGVGCHIPGFESLAAGADALLVVYDRALLQPLRLALVESGASLVVVEHHAVEMPSMSAMAEYIAQTFGVHARFYAREPRCEVVLG